MKATSTKETFKQLRRAYRTEKKTAFAAVARGHGSLDTLNAIYSAGRKFTDKWDPCLDSRGSFSYLDTSRVMKVARSGRTYYRHVLNVSNACANFLKRS